MDKSNKHSKDPPNNNNMAKTCEICGDIGTLPVSICCRCKITREHPYCMKIMHHDNPKDWVCDECELADQKRACSSKPGTSKLGGNARACSSRPGISELRDQTRACSSKPGPRGNIMKPPRSKVLYIPPEDAKRLESNAPKKNIPSRSKLNMSCRPPVNRTPPPKSEPMRSRTANRTSPLKPEALGCSTMNRTPPSFCVEPNRPKKPINTVNRTPPKFSVNPNTPGKPPVIKLHSASSLPNTRQDKQLSSSKDTEKHVAKKQHVRQDSPLAFRSAKEAQTSNATVEERRAAQPFWRNPSASKPSPGKNIKPNAERDNKNPGQISRQLVQDLRPMRSDKGPSRQLYRDNFAGMPVPREKVQCNTERVVKNAGRASMQSVHHSLATSSGNESLEHALELDRYLPNHPAEIPTWKGRFNISINDADLCRSIDGIQAHPPCKVQRKAYELSLKLPQVLEFELLPRLNIWGNLFDYSVPDSRDIGLYFLSPKISTLLDYMYEHNMLLRSQIDGVELLVFSSQHLAECSQRINNKFFLWGLFRPLEDNTEALGGESSEHMNINLSGGYGQRIIKQIPKLPKGGNADTTVQTVRQSSRDANPDPTVKEVPKRARNADRGPTVQAVQKPAKYANPDTTMLRRVQKSAKDANPGPTVDKLTPVKQESLDRDQPLATSYLRDKSEFDRDLQRSCDRFMMSEQPGQVRVEKVQKVPKSSKDTNPDPTVKAVPKRARNTNQGPTVHAVQKPAKNAKPGPTVEKLTPVKQESLDRDQPLATSYMQGGSPGR